MSNTESQCDNIAIKARQLKTELENGALLVDVRFINSIFKTGSIPKAIFIGIQGNLESWSYYLIENKSIKIYLLKEESSDYQDIKQRFERAGFFNVQGYLKGGIHAWLQEGFETEPYHAIHPKDFVNNFTSIDSELIIDVRSEGEYANQHIVGSQNIPLENLHQFITKLKAENQFYIICAGGYRSIIAASILKQNNIFKTVDVYGGIKNFP